MKIVTVLFPALFSIPSMAAPLAAPADISAIVSADGSYDQKYSNAVRNRFVVRKALGGEIGQTIVLESFSPGKSGSDDKILFSKNFPVTGIPEIKNLMAENPPEALYGCCDVLGITRAGAAWNFSINVAGKTLTCRSTETKANLAVTCAK